MVSEKVVKSYCEKHGVTEEYARAGLNRWDVLVPACGGHEVPSVIGHTKVLYCWNPKTGEHVYVDCGTDMVCDEHDLKRLGLSS